MLDLGRTQSDQSTVTASAPNIYFFFKSDDTEPLPRVAELFLVVLLSVSRGPQKSDFKYLLAYSDAYPSMPKVPR